jgi:hypothetical protein
MQRAYYGCAALLGGMLVSYLHTSKAYACKFTGRGKTVSVRLCNIATYSSGSLAMNLPVSSFAGLGLSGLWVAS